MLNAPPHLLQITTTSYSRDGVVGGGERIALYIDEAFRAAAEKADIGLTTSLLALDGRSAFGAGKDRYQRLVGEAWNVHSLNADDLAARIRVADLVYVHQCLTPVGLFAAAHARLLGKPVYGLDAGAGEAQMLLYNPNIMSIYDGVHALSVFAASAFEGFSTPVHVIMGPVDTKLHRPSADGTRRDSKLAVAVGRILPHKGHDRTIRALPSGMKLIIVGQHYDSAYLDYLRGCADGKDVVFEDTLDDADVRALLQRAGTFVHASTHVDYAGRYAHKPELLGLAPLEALACGTPTLVSDAACLPELAVVPGCRVFRNEDELAAMLREAASMPSDISAAEMHAAVDDKFGLDVVGARLLAMVGLGPPCT